MVSRSRKMAAAAVDQPPTSPAAPVPAAATEAAPSSQRRVQMTDLARMAGVSPSTVSRALSGSPLIPEATRDRIRELARSLHYQVNYGAANLRKRGVQTVGVVVLGDSMQAISDPFILSMVGAVADALDARGMQVLLARLSAQRQSSLAAMYDSGQVAGLIVIGQLTKHQYLNELARRGVPMAVWGALLPDALYSQVGGDNALGGYLATQHLLRQGCKRIAFFGDTTHPEAGLRHAGYVRALQEAGLAPDERLYQPFLFGDSRIRHSIDHWLDLGEPFDGVFACSDMTAVSLVSNLRDRGIEVPAQVKVVGYDDIPLSAHLHPSLTTVRQPTDQAGQALAELLFESVQGLPRRSVVLPTELVVRESSARSRAARATPAKRASTPAAGGKKRSGS